MDTGEEEMKHNPLATTVTFASASSGGSNMDQAASNYRKDKTIDQYTADAGLMIDFEQSVDSGKSFDYSKSVVFEPRRTEPGEQVMAYLSKIQRGGFVQSFGCMLVVSDHDRTFKVVAHSENCFDMLCINTNPEIITPDYRSLSLIGVDPRAIFSPASWTSLQKGFVTMDISLLNPIWVHCKGTQNPFYAILHRIDAGILIDLEPTSINDPALCFSGSVQSQKLAVRSIAKLQTLSGGDIGVLCDAVVDEVRKLTGYDRVMAYKFHDDGHGEVISEVRRDDLEPYLGIHYPATDIPQAARFLFKQNLARIICDCRTNPVAVIQSENLQHPLSLITSTLRAPHGCHAEYMSNMGSVASLVLAIVTNLNHQSKLWGLVVCHHTSSRYVPFPVRFACQFLMLSFSLQLQGELQLESQQVENNILHTQTLLCDMLLRDTLFTIITQSPNIMDLVKCEGAGLYYDGKCWLVGLTPTESQVQEIIQWLSKDHGDSTGLSTDSLLEAGYPGAVSLGETVCGMAMAKLSAKDFVFWFRSRTGLEIKWGGAVHQPGESDDVRRMHPRSSFNAFLEVAKSKSFPWEASEINAIHSLQLLLRGAYKDGKQQPPMKSPREKDYDIVRMEELSSVACEMVRLIETATAPIFGIDLAGLVNGWNSKIAELTGLPATEIIGKSLIHVIVHPDSRGIAEDVISKAWQGQEEKNVQLKLRRFGGNIEQGKDSVLYIVANTCISRDYTEKTIGVCFVGQDMTSEKTITDKFIHLQGDYKAIVHCLNPLIPPIFSSDNDACCSEWNAAMEKLTGYTKSEVIGKTLPGELFGGLCRLKGQDTLTKFMIVIYRGINGHDTERFPFGFFDKKGQYTEVLLVVNKRCDPDGNAIGCFCFLQTDTSVVQQAFGRHHRQDVADHNLHVNKLKKLAYIKQELKNPLNGIRFIHKLLEDSVTSLDQKQFLETSEACERQILSIMEDTDLETLDEDGIVELHNEVFLLGNVIDAIISQVMITIKENKLQLIHEIPDEVKTQYLFGDQIRLQLVLSDFLLNIVHYAPLNGWVEIKVSPSSRLMEDENEFIHFQIRITHPGQGLPPEIMRDMFDTGNQWTTQEGLGLNQSRKLLHAMNGNVQYAREEKECYFLIDLKLDPKDNSKPMEEDTNDNSKPMEEASIKHKEPA